MPIKSPNRFYGDPCPTCKGEGILYFSTAVLFKDCHMCGGTGAQLSDLGEELKEFIKNEYRGRF